ncbi:hypothetical protein RchiOBHm_Chr7g0239181 [Rosa chinensis]|uniref:Uncharacterized protein n=1 Tax=Rosa chinensis TaxID=74649 RepID=A0A2P6PHN2_ROSCH|nr:hypothetical protein RchiOBHm_Chr7g0239181 [Rosa chinensis]
MISSFIFEEDGSVISWNKVSTSFSFCSEKYSSYSCSTNWLTRSFLVFLLTSAMKHSL